MDRYLQTDNDTDAGHSEVKFCDEIENFHNVRPNQS